MYIEPEGKTQARIQTLEDPLPGRAQNVAKAKAARKPVELDDSPPPKRVCLPFVNADTLLIEKRVQEDKDGTFEKYHGKISYTLMCS